jgi:putative pyrroloquinoline-quinone binding quinoprotein
MKIQCSCGAKFSFDVTPDMAERRVQFVCSACGRDASEFVNQLIRQELRLPASSPAAATPPSPNLASGAAQVSPAAPAAPRVRLHTTQSPAAAVTHTAVEAPEPADAPQRCPKHLRELATEKCYVCSKPICPKCMELFGYVCSPLCRGKAEAQGLQIPVYAGQRVRVQARQGRWAGRAAWAIAVVILAVVGLWIWYGWFGSVPKAYFSVRFPEKAYSGQSMLCGKDQIVFLHGGLLARYDLKEHKQIWAAQLIDHKQIDDAVALDMKRTQLLIQKANNENPDHVPKMPDPVKLGSSMERDLASELDLRVRGQNVWVASPGKLVRYDWDTGKPVKEIALDEQFGPAIPCGDELLTMGVDAGKPVVTHVNLTTCDSRTQELAGSQPGADAPKDNPPPPGRKPAASPQRGNETAGLPVGMPGKDAGKGLDPSKVAEQAQHMSLPARIALPAILAVNMNQERALAELDDSPSQPTPAGTAPPAVSGLLIPAQGGLLQVSVRMLERKLITRNAMKAPPTKSALDGAVTMAKTTEVANEILNDIQRSRGGDTVTEDESRYLVRLRRTDGQDEWSGEVTGPPSLYPLKTVTVLTANKRIIVFDAKNRKLWQSPLNFNITGGSWVAGDGSATYGEGPCVEHKNALYVFDQGVLTAFDLPTGNVRWRLPSVGIAGLFFDPKDMLYVNTTTASPERIKYSRQIDISQKAASVVLKIDSKTGKVLWTAQPGGLLTYVSGQYLYAVQSYQPDEADEENPYTPDTGFETPPYLRIKRLNPKTGHELWEHFQQRAPLDVRFDQNSIELVFKKEVQVLRYLAF